MKEQELADLKVDRLIARFYFGAMLTLAVVSSSALASSIPIIILDLLPKWVDIVMAVGGVVVAPTSIHEVPVTKGWLDKVEQAVKNFESQNKIESPME
jgi:hypothetical protein